MFNISKMSVLKIYHIPLQFLHPFEAIPQPALSRDALHKIDKQFPVHVPNVGQIFVEQLIVRGREIKLVQELPSSRFCSFGIFNFFSKLFTQIQLFICCIRHYVVFPFAFIFLHSIFGWHDCLQLHVPGWKRISFYVLHELLAVQPWNGLIRWEWVVNLTFIFSLSLVYLQITKNWHQVNNFLSLFENPS